MGRYIPENDYHSRNFEPYKGFDEDMCTRCEKYYQKLYDQKITTTPFPPSCTKHVQSSLMYVEPTDFDTYQDYLDAIVLMDPIAWAEAEFGWKPRWYQHEMISCSSQYKILRAGRRIGKSESLIIEILHHITTHKYHTVLVVAPYERQVTKLFDDMSRFINLSANLRNSVSRYTKTPSRIEFNNGSKVLGFSAGATSSSGSDKIRGQDAHLIVIDEIDTIEDSDIDAVMAILASHRECRVIAASTPRGWIKRFHKYCTEKDAGFKEYWFISAESPEWTEKQEKFFRGTNDEVTFTHEYLADFAELEDGVFKAGKINACISDYDMGAIEYSDAADYIMGVDWNKSAGTHMVIMRWQHNKLTMVRKIVVDESQYTQTDSVQLIIGLNRHWKFKYIFVDAGYGTVQTELLKKHSLSEPSSMMESKLIPIHMNQNIKCIDPITGEEIKRFAKPYLIEQTKKLLDDGYITLPKSEDTTVNANNTQMGLIQQMRNFRVESYSVYGLPRYSQGQDHTLTAFYLACGGFFWKEGELKQPPYLRGAVGIEVSDTVNNTKSATQIEREQTARSGYVLKSVSDTKFKREINGIRRNINGSSARSTPSQYKRGKF